MTIGVGGSTPEQELAKMQDMSGGVAFIDDADREARLDKARALMREQKIDALYLDTTVNLNYFTGLNLKLTERLHGAILPADGPLVYLSPAFEEPKTRSMLKIDGDIRVWDEHEDPSALVIDTVESLGIAAGRLAIDPNAPFFNVDGLRRSGNRYELVNGAAITGACRSVKTPREIALLQRSNEITLEVHKAAARIMREGIGTVEVEEFILEAFRRLGGKAPQAGRPIVLFGEATAYPHGVDYPQSLQDGDMVLLDIGCFLGDYRSDMTRTYVFGNANPRQREVWELEKAAQLAGFAAARLGAPCEAVDAGARGLIEAAPGFEKDYKTPGLPHRTGHGIGIEVHEESYIVKNNKRPLEVGMCFSIEPMICIYGEFGIRLEDCAYMAEDGVRWFTTPSHSVDDPFGYEA
ncbi:M24 family metallopeptidase [Jiella avicenniae]|uniref:Xaa-Pro peptidase family protein n=1 Tax=Jiella avicenniae TaxID=2907202 RepID=A0A9X1P3S8_9HYPH|nr:Xaa-Pro peptidase family protein [Jiella avicenniae]MCE7029806.1 Xaa-Pro peptidase family protein [Jiella avicenniae]